MNQKKKRPSVRNQYSSYVETGERLKAAGAVDFESVYGSKEPGSFKIEEDAKELNNLVTGDIKMETKKPIVQTKKTNSAFEMPDPNAKMPDDMPVSSLGPDNEEAFIKEPEEEKELTIEEKCQEINTFITSVAGSSPDVQTLINWKRMHGDLFLLHMGEKVYLFRYLKRQELIQMKANPNYDQLTELQREEDVYHRCVLFPPTDAIQEASDPAGLMEMLTKQIKMQSMFLDEVYVAQLVIKI